MTLVSGRIFFHVHLIILYIFLSKAILTNPLIFEMKGQVQKSYFLTSVIDISKERYKRVICYIAESMSGTFNKINDVIVL